jgi:hypothetical protein
MAGSVANARKANTSGATSTTTTSFTGTTGNTIWVGVSDASGQGSLTISDNVVGSPNTYTQIGTTRTSASGAQIRRFCCQNITGRSGMTVTATWGSNSDATVHVLELAGVATASLDSAASAQADDNNPPWTVTSGTLAQADSIAVAMTGTAFNGTWSESSGFTVQTQEGDNNLYWTGCAATRVVAATTALTPSFTISGGGSDCAVAIDVFKAAAAGGTSLTPGVGAVTFSGFVPTIAQPHGVAPGIGAVTFTGFAPTIAQPHAAAPGAGTITFSGFAPTLAQTQNQALAPGAAAVAFTGFAPTLAQTASQDIAPDVGTLTLTGFSPTVVQASGSVTLAPGVGALALTGYAPTVSQSSISNAPSPSGASGSAKIPRGWPFEQMPVSSKERKRRKRAEEWAREQEAITERLLAAPVARISAPPVRKPTPIPAPAAPVAVPPAPAPAPEPRMTPARIALERAIDEALSADPGPDPRIAIRQAEEQRIRTRRKAEDEWIARAAHLLFD